MGLISAAPRLRRRDLPWGTYALGLWAAIVFLWMVVPVLMVIMMSFTDSEILRFPPQGFSLRHYYTFLESTWLQPALLSLRYAALSSVTKIVLGLLASLALVRGRFAGKGIINLILLSPLMIPPIIIAVAAYNVYVKLHLLGSMAGVVVAHTVLGTPTVILVLTATLYRFDSTLELAAMSLGASRLTTLWRITLPLIRNGIAVAVVFAFLDSFNELIVTGFIVGTRSLTLPVQIYTGLRFSLSPVIAAVSTLMVGATLLGLLGVASLGRRR